MARKVQLLSSEGEVQAIVDRDTARGLHSTGGWQWWNSGRALRQIPACRESTRSAPALHAEDAEALAGARPMTPRRRERLRGWGLVETSH
ncbi:MAG TPA: hypothetical protein VME18_02460 [Acidobacteriaceae bacterium]|nr:hypothetical protein [Acidobacteriaceae bacterium]